MRGSQIRRGERGVHVNKGTVTVEYLIECFIGDHKYVLGEEKVFLKGMKETARLIQDFLQDKPFRDQLYVEKVIERMQSRTLKRRDIITSLDAVHYRDKTIKESKQLLIIDYAKLLSDEQLNEFYQVASGMEGKRISPAVFEEQLEVAQQDIESFAYHPEELHRSPSKDKWIESLPMSFSPKMMPMSEIFALSCKGREKPLVHGELTQMAESGRISKAGRSNFINAMNPNSKRSGRAEYLFVLAMYFNWTAEETIEYFHACEDIDAAEITSFHIVGQTLLRFLSESDYNYPKFAQACCLELFEHNCELIPAMRNNYYWVAMYDILSDRFQPRRIAKRVGALLLACNQESEEEEKLARVISVIYTKLREVNLKYSERRYPDHVHRQLTAIDRILEEYEKERSWNEGDLMKSILTVNSKIDAIINEMEFDYGEHDLFMEAFGMYE